MVKHLGQCDFVNTFSQLVIKNTSMDINQPLDLSIPNRPCVQKSVKHNSKTRNGREPSDKVVSYLPYSMSNITDNTENLSSLAPPPASLSPRDTRTKPSTDEMPSLKIDPSAVRPICKTVCGITVTLHEPCLWDAFKQHGTEMIINRNGRRMFPHLDLSIEGLNPSQLYNILLEVCPSDDKRYKFISNRWVPVGAADPMQQNPPIVHHDSPNVGAFWMRKVSFARIKLTNYKDSNEGSIVLHSMHKYVSKIIIEPAGADGKGLNDKIVIPFEETAFYAVTAYQNEKIIQLKIHNNPFAKAFRDPRTSARPRVRNNKTKDNTTYSQVLESKEPSTKRRRGCRSESKSPTNPPDSPASSPPSPDTPSFPAGVPQIPQYIGMPSTMGTMNPMPFPFLGYPGMPGYPFPQLLPPMYYPPKHWIADTPQAFTNNSLSLPFNIKDTSPETTTSPAISPVAPEIKLE